MLRIGAAAAQSSFTEMVFSSGTAVETKLTETGLQGLMKHSCLASIDSLGTGGKSLGNFESGVGPNSWSYCMYSQLCLHLPADVLLYFCSVGFTLAEDLFLK